jgi:predicted enzyme related to lactoylglutathione lyase
MPKRASAPLGAPIWIDVFTSKPEVTRDFYTELLGWDFTQGPDEFGGYSTFSRDGEPMAGFMANHGDADAPEMWTVYLASGDAKATTDAVQANGGVVYQPAMEVGDLGVMAIIADSTGAHLGIWEPREHKGVNVFAEPGTPGWFELWTNDHPKALDFYRNAFGWDVHLAADTDEFRYATLGKDEQALAGVMDASSFLPEGVPPHWSVYFAVEDVDAAVAKATSLGATITAEAVDTPYGRLATLVDPVGAQCKLMGPNIES